MVADVMMIRFLEQLEPRMVEKEKEKVFAMLFETLGSATDRIALTTTSKEKAKGRARTKERKVTGLEPLTSWKPPQRQRSRLRSRRKRQLRPQPRLLKTRRSSFNRSQTLSQAR